VVVERGVVPREWAARRVRNKLRLFHDSPQGPQPDATGYKGFYYHFLDMDTGRRVWQCELSTIDSAFLFAGMLTCAAYFDGDTAVPQRAALSAAEGVSPGRDGQLPRYPPVAEQRSPPARRPKGRRVWRTMKSAPGGGGITTKH
jgi:hypothetical protein